MKKLLLLMIAVATLTITALLSGPVVQAAPPKSPLSHGPVTNRYSGDSAVANLSATTDGCLYSNIAVMAATQTVKSSTGGNSSGQYATLYWNKYNACTGEWIGGGDGYTTIDNASYQLNQKLTSAHLQAVIPVYDWSSGSTTNYTVNLTWTGSGDLTKGSSRYETQSPGCKISYNWRGSSRTATVTGTVSDGVTDYMSGASTNGFLQAVKSGDMTIGCGS